MQLWYRYVGNRLIGYPTLSLHFQVLFLHEGYYVAFLGLLAVSNGYLTTISFMFGPKVKGFYSNADWQFKNCV